MVLLMSELAKIGTTKPIFLDAGSLGGGGSCMHGYGLLSLYSSYTKFKYKSLFSFSLYSDLCSTIDTAKLLENVISLLCAKLEP